MKQIALILMTSMLFLSGCVSHREEPIILTYEPIQGTVVEDNLEEEVVEEIEVEVETEVESTFEVVFLDVGQADAALVSCDGEYMLIDAGNKEDSELIHTTLEERGIEQLSILVATHIHDDHIGGIADGLSEITSDIIFCTVTSYDSDNFHDFAQYASRNGGIIIPSVGDQYTLGSANIEILAVNSGEDINSTSIVLKVTYGETSFLFTGDAEQLAEQTMLRSGKDLSATVLKVGHHGGDSSTGDEFLSKVSPQYAVISCGVGNIYGAPADSVVNRIQNAGITLYRTDMQGSISCTSNGEIVTVKTVTVKTE